MITAFVILATLYVPYKTHSRNIKKVENDLQISTTQVR